MNVKQLNIMGYRGIKSLKLNLDPKTTVLIGENNTGKTSILHALDLVLNHQANSTDTWSKISPYDFYQTDLSNTHLENENFSITLLLSEKSQNEWSEDTVERLKDVLLTSIIKVIDNKKEKAVNLQQIKVKYIVNYQNNLNKFTTEVRFLSLKDEIINVNHTNCYQLLCQLINFSFLSALRDSSREFGKQGQFWNKLIKTINVPETDAIDIEQKLQSLNEQLLKSNEHLGTISNNFSKISRIISLKEDKPASFEGIPTRIFDTISNIKLFLTSNQNCKLPLERYGEGTQSLSVLQLFQAFTELINDNESTSILALEEPEAHLHPSATRKLASIINNLSEQVIVSSHSGDFVSSVDLNSIRRLYKKNGETFVGQVNETTNLDDNELRLFKKNVLLNRGSYLFSNCWLLVEGETEFWFFSTLFANPAFAFASEDYNYSIITVAQYGSVSPYVKIAEALGIEWALFADNDDSGKNMIKKAKNATIYKNDYINRIFTTNKKTIEYDLWELGCSKIFVDTLNIEYKKKLERRSGNDNTEFRKLVIENEQIKTRKPYFALKCSDYIVEQNINLPNNFSLLLDFLKKCCGVKECNK